MTDVQIAMVTLAQCPCSGGGAGFATWVVVGLAFGLWWLIGWTRSTWNTGASPAGRVGKLALIGLLVAGIVAVVGLKIAQSSLTAAGTRTASATTYSSGIPKLVDLGSKSCIPCKMMAPILEELKTEYVGKFDVEVIDVSLRANQPLARQYGIRLIPTQIFFDKDGKELWRHEGFLGKAEILAKWRELGIAFEANRPSDSVTSGKTADVPLSGGQ